MVHSGLVVMSRERDHLDFELAERRRRLLGPVKNRVPWYSPHSNRNILLVASLLTGLMFFRPICDICKSVKSSYRLYNEQEKFKKELDAEMQELSRKPSQS